MTLKELREAIKEIPKKYDALPVWKSSDPEGNSYYEVRGIDDEGLFTDSNKYCKESIGQTSLSTEENGLDDLDEKEYEAYKAENKCIVIF